MKTATLLIALLVFQSGGFTREKYDTVKSRSAHAVTHSGVSGFNNDLTLVKPLINTNDTGGGYYSKYWYHSFQFMYCGAVIKNTGTLNATHLFMEMKAYDISGVYLQSWFSDTLPVLLPGVEATVNIPGEINFQPWISNTRIDHLLFIARSDSVDDNPANNQQTVPFTVFFYDMWTMVSRSVNPVSPAEIGPANGFQPGDFIGFTLLTAEPWHRVNNMKVYVDTPWSPALHLTAMLFENGRLLDSAAVILPSPPEPGWANSISFTGDGFNPDSLYYAGISFSGSGTGFIVGTDTSAYHNFGAETVARKGGNWSSLSFVPAMEVICDPEGIPEIEKKGPFICPNPATQTLFISNVGSAELQLYDLAGKLLLTDRQKAPFRKLDISVLSPGVYFLQIITDAHSLCEKIIIR